MTKVWWGDQTVPGPDEASSCTWSRELSLDVAGTVTVVMGHSVPDTPLLGWRNVLLIFRNMPGSLLLLFF